MLLEEQKPGQGRKEGQTQITRHSMPSASTRKREVSDSDVSGARHPASRDEGANGNLPSLKRMSWTQIQAGTAQPEARNPDLCVSAASSPTRVIDSKFCF